MTVDQQVEYAFRHLEGATVTRQPDGIHVLRWPFEMGGPWVPSSATLIVMIPPLFPAQAPSGFDTVEPVNRAGAAPGGVGLRQVGGEQWLHWCWNPNGALDYTAEDAIWRFAKFAESRFLTLQ